jgi:hypothetical protein
MLAIFPIGFALTLVESELRHNLVLNSSFEEGMDDPSNRSLNNASIMRSYC